MRVLIFSITLSEKLFILGIIKRYIIINVRRCSWKVHAINHILTKLGVAQEIFQNTQISNFMKIRPVEPSCSRRTGGQTDRHDEANSYFCQFLKAPKNSEFQSQTLSYI